MIKFAFDKEDLIRNQPYPNLWDDEVIISYNHITKKYDYDTHNQDFILHTCHSELFWNLIENDKDKFIYLGDSTDLNNFYFYPIEIYGNHKLLLKGHNFISKSGKKYTTSFIKNVSNTAIKLAKLNKLKFIINISHEKFSDIDFIKQFTSEIISIGLKPNQFIFFVGTSNLYDLHPELKNFDYKFLFEDSLIISSAQKVRQLQFQPNFTLGYKTEWIHESDINLLRNKHFVCPNRSSNKPHRYTLGCFFEHNNMWDRLYASFLHRNQNRHWLFETNDIVFDSNIKKAADSFSKKIPVEFDTQDSINKESFEAVRAYKREVYLDSYLHIVTETNFEKDIFVTEKICNPMVVLQPFILFGAAGYLKYLRYLGFQTFDGFIDESYDLEFDDKKRYLMLCSEIERISKISLTEIHNWYLSIRDTLIYNRNHLLTFADKKMFIQNLKNVENQWFQNE